MDPLFNIFLVLHITSGTIGLLTGTYNLIRTKGDRMHKNIGKIFSLSMLMTGVSALVLAILNPNYFLFIIGIFTIYLTATGHRYIYLKMLSIHQRPKELDWLITISMLLAGIIFLVMGILQLISGTTFGIVFIVFGMIGLLFVKTDFANYRGKVKGKNYWLVAHLQRMTAAYIAAFTAFLVVNADNIPVPVPAIVFWLLPTVLLTPLIVMWTRRRK